VTAFESVSSWRQPMPVPVSAERTAVIGAIADRVAALDPGRLRVAVDGRTCAGKTSFGHELAAALRHLGRPTMRASLDDFKHPWRHAREHGYDRLSGEGYYRNAYDFRSACDLLLGPAGPAGSGMVALCGHDPLTGEDHRASRISAPEDAILVVDSVFAFRPEYNDYWEYRIWLDVDPGTALRRGIARDRAAEGVEGATRVHSGRYYDAETIYLAEVRPQSLADVIIDNRDFASPRIVSGAREMTVRPSPVAEQS
jgi:uridine kinase